MNPIYFNLLFIIKNLYIFLIKKFTKDDKNRHYIFLYKYIYKKLKNP